MMSWQEPRCGGQPVTEQQHTVLCRRAYPAPAEALWQIVSDFYSDWHPFIEQCIQETPQPIRRFTMPGSEQVYREQRIFYSDTLRTLHYEMLEGISGIERYRGGLRVEKSEAGCLLSWWADIEGDATFVEKIAEGTEQVFLAGFDELEERVKAFKTPHPNPSPQGRGAFTVVIGNKSGNDNNLAISGQEDLINGTASHPLSLRERGPGGEGTRSALTYHPSPNNPDWLCLFLHGIGGNRNNWNPQLPAIAQIMPCAAMDLRGYGDSPLAEKQTTVEDYCADIREVVKQLNTKHLVLAGLSYGAWIATHFALHYSDELAGLVLCGGCTGMSEASEETRQGFLKARLEPMNKGLAPADFASGVVEIISGPYASDAQKKVMEESMAAIPAETYRDALHCFTHPPTPFDFSLLNCPVLLMTGEHDRLAPPDEIAGVAMRMANIPKPGNAPLPDIRFEVLHQAGHLANLEQAEQFNQQLLRQLHYLIELK